MSAALEQVLGGAHFFDCYLIVYRFSLVRPPFFFVDLKNKPATNQVKPVICGGFVFYNEIRLYFAKSITMRPSIFPAFISSIIALTSVNGRV